MDSKKSKITIIICTVISFILLMIFISIAKVFSSGFNTIQKATDKDRVGYYSFEMLKELIDIKEQNKNLINYNSEKEFLNSFFWNTKYTINENSAKYASSKEYTVTKFVQNCEKIDIKDTNNSDCIIKSLYSDGWGNLYRNEYIIDGGNNIIYPTSETEQKISKYKEYQRKYR